MTDFTPGRHATSQAEGTEPLQGTAPITATRWAAVSGYLALNRSTATTAVATLLMTLGEELWRRFLPTYLRALGAPAWGVGVYGSARDLLDGLYQYPGGWAADQYGRWRALRGFVLAALTGYVVLATTPSWPTAIVGVGLAMAWTSMASPALFAVIGDALPPSRRTMGFSVQSIVRRVPIVVAPTLGGTLILVAGPITGVRLALMVSALLALVTMLVIRSNSVAAPVVPHVQRSEGLGDLWRSLPTPLRRLLGSDILIRTCESLADVFIVVYALEIVGLSAAEYGMLVGVQMFIAIVCYLPAARMTEHVGRKPFVIGTFVAFSTFPLAVVSARTFAGLMLAFVIGGLREIGEPARKALIVNFARPDLRASSVGLYYLLRSVAIAPAAVCGGLLWRADPRLPFILAGLVGLLGTALFTKMVDAHHAG
jgi:MFS family permease